MSRVRTVPNKVRVVSQFFIWDKPVIYQSQEHIVEFTEYGESSVRNALKWMMENGWLERVAVGSSFGRQGFSSQYRRLIPEEHRYSGTGDNQEHPSLSAEHRYSQQGDNPNTGTERGAKRITTVNRDIEVVYPPAGADAPEANASATGRTRKSLKDTEAPGVGAASASAASYIKDPVPDSDQSTRESVHWVNHYGYKWAYRPTRPTGPDRENWKQVKREEVNPDYRHNVNGWKFRETSHYERNNQ